MKVAPREGDSMWEGGTAATGHMEELGCAPTVNDGTGGGTSRLATRFVPNAGPAAPPPPDPAVVARQAIEQLQIPQPQLSLGPDQARIGVNLWTWLWVDDPGALTSTATVEGVSVTAVARLSSVTWDLGEPAGDGATSTVTCDGAGVEPDPATYDWTVEPACGYRFRQRSLPERTGATGTWPVSATTTWNLTWQATTGDTGATTLTAVGTSPVSVGEYGIALVDQGG